MSDAVIFTEQEQDDLDGDPVRARWRMANEARARRLADGADVTGRGA
ncbi:MAG: hypothetical protein Q7V58_15985 [Actinomycetota bacterium]|nr:hypothetical protein [Actinomycetota bacterium]